jgi:hypothetical protein
MIFTIRILTVASAKKTISMAFTRRIVTTAFYRQDSVLYTARAAKKICACDDRPGRRGRPGSQPACSARINHPLLGFKYWEGGHSYIYGLRAPLRLAAAMKAAAVVLPGEAMSAGGKATRSQSAVHSLAVGLRMPPHALPPPRGTG